MSWNPGLPEKRPLDRHSHQEYAGRWHHHYDIDPLAVIAYIIAMVALILAWLK